MNPTIYTTRLLLCAALFALSTLGQAAFADSTAVEITAQVAPVVQAQSEYVAEPEAAAVPEPVAAAHADNPGGALTLEEAIERALAGHPALSALDKEYWALDSIAWQEGRRPNPELELEFEEFGGTNEARGVRALATSLTYTQPIERGGKRSARETAASLERELVLWDMAELEYEVQAEVRLAYANVQAAQFGLQQLSELRELEQRIADTISISVEAGRSARLELERFEIELARLDLELAAAERNLQQARTELAAAWGATEVDFDSVVTTGADPAELPGLAELLHQLEHHPALERFAAEYEVLCALVDLEHANAKPDMAIFGGMTRLNEIEETVFKVGVAFDLTTNDRNEGAISAAAKRLEQVEDNRAAVERELTAELTAVYGFARIALANYLSYEADLLPAAAEALDLTEEGYRYGKFELMDVLDAQRTVVELKSEQADALSEYRMQVAEIEALLDIDLDELPLLTDTEETELTDQSTAPADAGETNNE